MADSRRAARLWLSVGRCEETPVKDHTCQRTSLSTGGRWGLVRVLGSVGSSRHSVPRSSDIISFRPEGSEAFRHDGEI